MEKEFFRQRAVLAKAEAVYATDSEPTGEANAMKALDGRITPMQADEQRREVMKPHLGGDERFFLGKHVATEFAVDMVGAGADDEGDPPPYDPLLRACGLAATIDEGVDVTYDPVSSLFESASLYLHQNGRRHRGLGARGNVRLRLARRETPRFIFAMIGLFSPVTTAALPAANFSAFDRPQEAGGGRTTLSLHGYAAVATSIELDLGNRVTYRPMINEEAVRITDRDSTGTIVIDTVPLGTFDPYALNDAGTLGPLSIVHGTAAGRIVEITAPAVQLGPPAEYQNDEGVTQWQIPLFLQPDEGDDEMRIVVR